MPHLPTIGGQSKSEEKKRKLILLTPEFFKKWDSFVETHPLGSIYHLSGWKKVLEESFKHIKAILSRLCEEDSNEILAGLPLYLVNSKITGKRYVSSPFANFCGPLTTDPKDAKHLFDYLIGIYNQQTPSYMEVKAKPNDYFDGDIPFGASANYLHHFIELSLPPNILLRNFHKKAVRVSISKAMKNGLLLKSAESEQDMFRFYQIYHKARKRIGLPAIPYKFFKKLWEVFHPAGQLQLIMCVLDHKVIGASILLKFKDWVYIEYGHDLLEYRKLCVNHFLDWEAIKLASQEEYKFLSFGRTALNNSGLIQYKNRWGTTIEQLFTYTHPETDGEADKPKEASWKYRLVRKMCVMSPRLIYDLLSASVYRHMG